MAEKGYWDPVLRAYRVRDVVAAIPLSGGFKGTCDLHTDPGVPEADEWWSATEVGVYANFGDVEVTTMDEVFNYIRWTQATETWSIETVAINMAMVQIPKVVDGVWDLNVSKNLEIEVKPYPFRKIADPGYPYFYAGAEANPAYHSRLNLDGDLYLSKLFAWGINMPSGTPLKWLTLDANRNIVFSDAPAGGATPNDDILKWGVNKYAPYPTRIDDNEWIKPYFYEADGVSFNYPIHYLPVYLDGSLTAFSLEASKDLTGGSYVTYFVNSENGIGISLYNGVYKTFSIKHDSSGSLLLSANSGSSLSDKIYIGSKTAVGSFHGEHVVVDDFNYRFDINMTKVRFNKGTASRYLYVDANKEVGYTEMPAIEVRIINTENLATSRKIILEPAAAYNYSIVSLYCITQDSSATVHVEYNSTSYQNFSFDSTGSIMVLGNTVYLPATLPAGGRLQIALPGGEGRCTFRLILKRTTF